MGSGGVATTALIVLGTIAGGLITGLFARRKIGAEAAERISAAFATLDKQQGEARDRQAADIKDLRERLDAVEDELDRERRARQEADDRARAADDRARASEERARAAEERADRADEKVTRLGRRVTQLEQALTDQDITIPPEETPRAG